MKPRTRLRTLTRRPSQTRPRDRRRWIPLALGAVTAAAVGGYPGLAVGTVTALAVHMTLRRLEPPETRRARARDRADLPFTLDVFASCLRAGAPLDRALTNGADTANPALAGKLHRASRCLTLGGTVAEALSELDGIHESDRLTRTIARSADTGARLADGLSRLAEELRFETEQAALSKAHRAGVWMVLPLCLCFLPAFIVAGLIPVVIASLDGVLNTY